MNLEGIAGFIQSAVGGFNTFNSLPDNAFGYDNLGRTIGSITPAVGDLISSGMDMFATRPDYNDLEDQYRTMSKMALLGNANIAALLTETAANTEADLMEYNAVMSDIEAIMLEQKGLADRAIQKRDQNIEAGQRRVAAGSSGMTMDTFSDALVRQDAVANWMSKMLAYDYDNAVNAKRQEGQMQRYEAELRRASGRREAWGTRMSAWYQSMSGDAAAGMAEVSNQRELDAARMFGRKPTMPYAGFSSGDDTRKKLLSHGNYGSINTKINPKTDYDGGITLS